METSITVDRYLARIGIHAWPPVDLDGLTTLQRAHLTAVPFENLDVHARTGVRTDTGWSLPKIVDRERGGWCFENNGAFGWLLGELGFTVDYVGAYVLLDPADTDHMSHLTLIVHLDKRYLVDVGFGDSFIEPVPIDGTPIDDGNERYAVINDDPWLRLKELTENVIDVEPSGRPLYQFQPTSRSLTEFDEESDRLQAGSMFTEKPFATRLLDGGPDRVTLLQDRLKFRRAGEWTESPVIEDHWENTYRRWFTQSD